MAVRPSESTMDDGKSQVLSVKWNQHMELLANNTSKLFRNEQYSDVTLSCTEGKNTEIPAHKLVLSGCSEYFYRLFQTNKLQQPVIVITNVCESTVIQILEYMYKGEVAIPYSEVPKFMNAAKTFQVVGLLAGVNSSLPARNNEDVQGKELDLSRNRKVENVPNETTSNSPSEESPSIPKSFIPPSQPALNSALLNHAHLIPMDNHILNTAALALRNNSQFLSSRLGSPSRISHSAPTLPKRSPSAHLESPKHLLPENHCRDSSSANNRRFSNSPEESVHSNASLDLTKASSSNSPLNRLVPNPLSSLVSAADQNSHSSISPMSAVLASQLNPYSPFQSQIHVSQSLIHKRSRSKSPESGESKPSQDCADENNTSPRLHDDQGNSPHDSEQSGKQNSSGGASEHYSDDDSGPEAKYNESVASRTAGNCRAGSVSPGPSTSTPKVSEAFSQGYPRMPWTYGGGDDSKIVTDVPAAQAELFARLLQAQKSVMLGNPNAAAFPTIAQTISQIPSLPQTLANFQALSTMTNSSPFTAHQPSNLSAAAPNPMTSHMAAILAEQSHMHPQQQQANPDQPRGKKRKIQTENTTRFCCDACDRSYASHGNLKRHKKYECGQPPAFKCQYCDSRFQHRHSLKIHTKTTHKVEFSEQGEILPEKMMSNNAVPQVTNVSNSTPSSSPPLQIVDDEPPEQISAPLVNQNLLALGSIKRENMRTIATAEVSVASVPRKDIENKFLALQLTQSQSSNTDNV